MRYALILLAVLAFAILSGHRLDAPWLPAGNGDEAYAGAQYHAISRHILRHGLWRTRAAQFRIFHDLSAEEINNAAGEFRGEELRKTYGDRFWVSRLPFGALLHAAALRLASERDGGGGEWALRLVPFFSGLSLIALFGLLLRSELAAAAPLVSAVCALMPGTVIWARMPGYEMPCLALSAAALIFYAAHRAGWQILPFARNFSAAWLCALAASILGWFGLLSVAIMLADIFLKSADWRKGAALAFIPALLIALYVCYLRLLGQPLGERLVYFWEQRSVGSAISLSSRPLDMAAYLCRVPAYFFNHLTPLPLALGVGWLWLYGKARRRGECLPEAWLVLALAVFAGLVYVLALRSSFEHRCYTLWWLPFLALSGGCFLQRACLSFSCFSRRAALIAVFATLAACSAYKIWRQEQKGEKAAARIAFFRECADLIPRDAAVAVGGIGGFSAAAALASHAAGCREFRVTDAKHPALFYLWRRTSPALLCRCGPVAVLGPSYVILPRQWGEQFPAAARLRERAGLALIQIAEGR